MTTSTVSRLGRAPEEGIKAPVKASTIVNLASLSGNGFAVGSTAYVVQTGDRILVRSQTLPAENGIYLVGPNAWERASDMNADNDVVNGQLILDAATGTLFTLSVTGPWTPGATPITFPSFVTMPARVVITDSSAVDLVDTAVALTTGALDPDTAQHLEFDFQSIQSKSDATTAADLFLNPLGGDVQILADLVISGLVDGVDVAALDAAAVAHFADGTIHFTQASISITASQISDFAAAVAADATVAANTAKVSNVPTALSIGTQAIGTLAITSDGGADDVVLPSFTATEAGLAPGSGGGSVNFLRADGSWANPPGTGNNFTAVVETTTSRTAAAFEAVFVDDDTAGSTVTITLPAGSTDDQIIVKKLGTTANVIIDGDAAETIDGAATFTLTAQYASVTVMWNGTEWSII